MKSADLMSRLGRPCCVAAGVLILLAFCPTRGVGAQGATKPFSLTTSSGFGFLYGQADEEVYDQNAPPGPDYKLSELIWPFHGMAYMSEGLDLSTRLGLFASLSVREGFPGVVGTMTDSDFLNGDGTKTHYSQSDSYAERYLGLDVSLGYDVFRSGPFALGIFGRFEYEDFKFSARDGYTQYPSSGEIYSTDSSGNLVLGTYTPWSASETETPLYGTIGLYEQAYIFGAFGFKASYALSRAWEFGASISLAPLVFGYSQDDHLLRVFSIYGKYSSGLEYEPKLFAQYNLRPGAALRLDLSYAGTSALVGNGTYINEGYTSTDSTGGYYAGPDSASELVNGAGASISMFQACLSFRLDI